MDNSKYTVAIHCMVYNHEPFLRQCLDGFVMQQTSFPFFAIVHDDASTDHSADIIREYAAKYPDIIHPIYETENQYCKPGTIFRIMFEAGKDAEYTAYCEGDDYWTDPHKLQRQVDFLKANPEYSAIGENAMVLNSITNTQYPFKKADSHDVTIEQLITYRRFPTAGVVCRTESLKGILDTCRFYTDTIQWCWLCSKGKVRYDSTISSVYRRGLQGVTEYTSPLKFAQRIERWNLEILRCFDVRKSFIYNHLAKIYNFYFKQAFRHHDFYSAFKCINRGLTYAFKSLLV